MLSLALEGLTQNAFGPHSIYGDPSEGLRSEMRARRASRPPLTGDTQDEVLAMWVERWGRESQEDAFARYLRSLILPLPGGRWGLLCPPAVTDAYMESFWEARFDKCFEAINRPVLFLPEAGAMADPTARASLAWFRSLLRHSAVVEIPGARHAGVVLDQTERFARAVLQFHRHVTLLT